MQAILHRKILTRLLRVQASITPLRIQLLPLEATLHLRGKQVLAIYWRRLRICISLKRLSSLILMSSAKRSLSNLECRFSYSMYLKTLLELELLLKLGSLSSPLNHWCFSTQWTTSWQRSRKRSQRTFTINTLSRCSSIWATMNSKTLD